MPFAEQAKLKGRQVHHLNIGQPDILTPPEALQKLKSTPLDILAYSPGIGQQKLRASVANYQIKKGVTLDENQVIVTSGASEGMYFILLACLDPGDNIIVPEPFYANYSGFAHMAGIQIKPITCKIEEEFALPAIEKFENLIDDRTKAILITNPNNPTGCIYSKEKLNELSYLIKRHNLFLFADEVYQDFCFTNEGFFSTLRLENISKHVLVMDSVSKKYSSCGARIGYIYTRNKQVYHAIERLAKLRLSPPALSENLALYMLEKDSSYLNEAKTEYDLRRQYVYQRLSSMKNVQCYLPKGAFYCFAKFPIKNAEHFCQWLLEEFEYNGQTVMLSPGAGFYATDGLGKDEVRIAFVLDVKKLQKAMDCLEEGLKQYIN